MGIAGHITLVHLLDPQFSFLDPQVGFLDPKVGILDPKVSFLDPQLGITAPVQTFACSFCIINPAQLQATDAFVFMALFFEFTNTFFRFVRDFLIHL